MALTYSQPLGVGTEAPPFHLRTANPGADGRDGDTRRLGDFADAKALVVVFMCNHCPYVVHVQDELVRLARDYAPHGVQLVGINSNSAETHPADSFERMQERAAAMDYPFSYLHDETQDVARAYGAVCTPDPYVFDADRRLVYHGRLDATRPGQGTADGAELRRALDQLLEEGRVTGEQHPAMGCNIKWKPGRAPH